MICPWEQTLFYFQFARVTAEENWLNFCFKKSFQRLLSFGVSWRPHFHPRLWKYVWMYTMSTKFLFIPFPFFKLRLTFKLLCCQTNLTLKSLSVCLFVIFHMSSWITLPKLWSSSLKWVLQFTYVASHKLSLLCNSKQMIPFFDVYLIHIFNSQKKLFRSQLG